MTITFGPLDYLPDSTNGSSKLRLRARGNTEPGNHGLARLYLRAAATAYLSGDAEPPAELVSGLAGIGLTAGGGISTHEFVSGGTGFRLRSRGLASKTGQVSSRHALTLRAWGHTTVAGSAYALVLAPPATVLSEAGIVYVNLRDGLVGAETRSASMILVIRELVLLSEDPRITAEALLQVTDGLKLSDAVYPVLLQLINEGLVLSDTLTLNFLSVARAVSKLLVGEQARSYAEAISIIADGMALADVATGLRLEQVLDGVTFAESFATAAAYYEKALDGALLAGELTTTHTGMVLVEDGVEFGDELVGTAELIELIRDGLALSVHLTLDNGQYVAWTINAGSGGVSTFDNYRFNSYAQVGGVYYGASPEGLFRLDGDTDDGDMINARLRLGMDQMRSRLEKSFSEVYVGYTGTGEMLLRVIITDDGTGQKIAGEYLMKPRPAAGRRESRFEPGKGLKAVYFDFEIENLRGADFDLSAVDFQPMFSNRRTRG